MSAKKNQTWTITEALVIGRSELGSISTTPELDAQLLLGFVLNLSRLELVVEAKKVLEEESKRSYCNLLERRKNREPVAYITGKKEFWGLELAVTPNVLIPRPDTELLVETALTFSADFADPLLAFDLGTGSGCIALALSFELKRRRRNFFMLAADKSVEAIKIAKQNAQTHSLEQYINFVCSDWSSAVGQDFDLVVSNPPYLMENDREISAELQYEPQSALYAGRDGLEDYRKIFQALPNLLSSHGVFLGEIGYGQAHQIEALAKELLPRVQIEFHYDLRKIQRVVEIRLG
jgi:release factor glutamine methyltransferase